ncbi:unnamed protein product [Ostreobium quekettii]|uniref:Uncharacterized protein n=1 Tax=Ostreobium quekettii TaxID=121088 RepID=A0A8S1JCL6_9CHLO|nr:unnamed protein product [Ostreobium quekettii]
MRSAARAPRTLRPRGLPSGPLLALALLCLAEPAACRSPPASDRAARSLLQSAADDAEGFLSGSLPLEIVATTPSDLGAAPRRAVDGSQALTVGGGRWRAHWVGRSCLMAGGPRG